jgi:hypothetical protein
MLIDPGYDDEYGVFLTWEEQFDQNMTSSSDQVFASKATLKRLYKEAAGGEYAPVLVVLTVLQTFVDEFGPSKVAFRGRSPSRQTRKHALSPYRAATAADTLTRKFKKVLHEDWTTQPVKYSQHIGGKTIEVKRYWTPRLNVWLYDPTNPLAAGTSAGFTNDAFETDIHSVEPPPPQIPKRPPPGRRSPSWGQDVPKVYRDLHRLISEVIQRAYSWKAIRDDQMGTKRYVAFMEHNDAYSLIPPFMHEVKDFNGAGKYAATIERLHAEEKWNVPEFWQVEEPLRARRRPR